jgi:hypothetical protein
MFRLRTRNAEQFLVRRSACVKSYCFLLKLYYPPEEGSLTGGSVSDGAGKSGGGAVLVSGVAGGPPPSGEVGMLLYTAMWKVSFVVGNLRGRSIPDYLLV